MTVQDFYEFCKDNHITNYKIFADQISLAGCFTGYKELTEKEIDISYGEQIIYIK